MFRWSTPGGGSIEVAHHLPKKSFVSKEEEVIPWYYYVGLSNQQRVFHVVEDVKLIIRKHNAMQLEM